MLNRFRLVGGGGFCGDSHIDDNNYIRWADDIRNLLIYFNGIWKYDARFIKLVRDNSNRKYNHECVWAAHLERFHN